jgi:ATP-dependent helicase/nuclease subunit A
MAVLPATPAPQSTPVEREEPKLPTWLRQNAPVRAPRPVPLAPSAAFAGEIARQTPSAARDRQKALQRGQIVHRLMQSLPDVAPSARKAALEHYLSNAGRHLSSEERGEIARHVFAILEDDRFAEVFAAASRPEVPIVGRIPRPNDDPVLVAGQVDRLVVTSNAVLAVDYKTDSVVPESLAQVPRAYIAQLALYRAVLMRIYPQKSVGAALIFSAGPVLLEVPAAMLEAALQREIEQHGSERRHAPVSAA